jgi:transcriptional regulator with XRE-family HTH domain
MHTMIYFLVNVLGLLFSRAETISPIDQYVIDFVLQLRKDKNQTQQDIANILQVSRSFIKDVENSSNRAKYNLTHINALADYFGMKLGDFLPIYPIPVDKKAEKKVTNLKNKKPVSKAVKKKAVKKATKKK